MSDERTPGRAEGSRDPRLEVLQRDLAESVADIEAGRIENTEDFLADVDREIARYFAEKHARRSA